MRWTCKSTRNLAEALSRQGHCVSYQTVAVLLHELGYSLQALRKTREGGAHPDRDAQFRYINQQVIAFQERGQPVVSVDTKKKELVGGVLPKCGYAAVRVVRFGAGACVLSSSSASSAFNSARQSGGVQRQLFRRSRASAS